MSHSDSSASSLFVPVSSLLLGTCFVAGTAFSIYQLKTTPQLFDKDAIWGLLFEKSGKANYMAWFLFLIGFVLSIAGFLTATVWLWNERVSDALGFFYCLFLLSEALWMPFAIRGLEYYSATIMVMFTAAIASCGLFVTTLELWGSDSYKGFILLPLFLHCTLFDLFAWSCSFEPRSVSQNLQTIELLEQQSGMFSVHEEDDPESQEKASVVSKA